MCLDSGYCAAVRLARIMLLVALVVALGSASTSAATKPVAVILGDSYVSGSDMGGRGAKGFPAIVAAKLGWDMRLQAEGGTGYTVDTGDGKTKPYPQRVGAVIAQHPRYVIVFGSRNDIDAAKVAGAAKLTFSRIRAGLPHVRLIVIGPPWVDAAPPSNIVHDRDAIKAAALRAHATFIDPLAEKWFTGAASSLIGSDGVHPTDAGHAYMARLILRDFKRLGIH